MRQGASAAGIDDRHDIRIVVLGLYSQQYPAIGESHGLSVVAGELLGSLDADISLHLMDMLEWGEEDCQKAVELIREVKANALAIGMPYGTFSVLKRQYDKLRAALDHPEPLVVIGGPIATYVSDRVLQEIAPDAVVIVGEAEDALPGLVSTWQQGGWYRDVPNLHYLDRATGADVRTPRRLVDLVGRGLPYRRHVRKIRDQGGQIFVETSRGCSWAACTFCLRGLTDVAGRGYEYRRREPAQITADLTELAAHGIREVTIADEDFLGPSLGDAERFIDELADRLAEIPMRLEASVTVHSVFSRRDSPTGSRRREALIRRLADIGLKKAFLGIESCSPGQLKRYAKGHTREEAIAAARRLERFGIRVEIGVILFDPLCSLEELAESLVFMRDNALVEKASSISSELRLQAGSRYLPILQAYEARSGRRLHDAELDPDTLTYPYSFADEAVARLFAAVNRWNRRLHPLYYPAKSLSRFGSTGAVGSAVHALREATGNFRNETCDVQLRAIEAIRAGDDFDQVLRRGFTAAADSLALAVKDALAGHPRGLQEHPVISKALSAALNYDPVPEYRQSPATKEGSDS